MIALLTAVFAQSVSTTPHIQATVQPIVGGPFVVELGDSRIAGRVHRAEIVDFGLEVSGITKSGWFAYRHDRFGKIAVSHNI